MAFPSSGLPNAVTIWKPTVTGEDAGGNAVLTVAAVVTKRQARYYRDKAREMAFAQDSNTVQGVVCFKWASSDLNAFTEASEVTLYGGQFGDINGPGIRFEIVHLEVKELWSRPCHWEIVLGRTT